MKARARRSPHEPEPECESDIDSAFCSPYPAELAANGYSLQKLFGVSHEVESCTSQLAKEAIKARKGVCQRIVITLPVGELASEQSTTW
jgi:hypothetical protein